MIESTTRLLGQLSKNLAFVVSPARDTRMFRHIQLIWLSEGSGLVVVVTSVGVLTQRLFEFPSELDADALTRLSNRLNAKLGGKMLRDIALPDVLEVVRAERAPEGVAAAIVEVFAVASGGEEPSVSSAGAQHLLDQPEFHDLRKLRSILRIIEEQKKLYDLVLDSMHAEGPIVKIGQELGSDEITECSLVTIPYSLGDETLGVLAILGPRRMPYGRLLALASLTAQSLNHYLSNTRPR